MKIFIGGSRAVSRINQVVRARLDEFIRRGDFILIGDANQDLQGLIARCDRRSIEAASRALGVTLHQPPLPLVHS